MADNDLNLLKENWRAVEEDPEALSRRLYDRLFELDPSTEELFPDDMAPQRDKFIVALRMVITSLERGDDLQPVLVGMGKRHADYDVYKDDFDTVGQALLDALEGQLGSRFTSFHKEAWARAYEQIAGPMIDQVPARPKPGFFAKLFRSEDRAR